MIHLIDKNADTGVKNEPHSDIKNSLPVESSESPNTTLPSKKIQPTKQGSLMAFLKKK